MIDLLKCCTGGCTCNFGFSQGLCFPPNPAVPVGLSVAEPQVVVARLVGTACPVLEGARKGSEPGAGGGRVKATLSSRWHEVSH